MLTAATSTAHKVAVVTKSFPPAFRAGGPARSVAALTELLRATADVRVVSSLDDNGHDLRLDGVPERVWAERAGVLVYNVPAGMRACVRVVASLRRLRADVVHLNSLFHPAFSLAPLAAAATGLLRGQRLVVAPRGELAEAALGLKSTKKRLVLGAIRIAGMHRRVTWHATSPHEVDDIRREFGDSADVRLAPVIRSLSGPANERHRPAVPNPRVLLLSKIDRMKNIDLAIEIVARCSSGATLTVAGPVKDEAYWAECLAAVERTGLGTRFTYAGPVAPDDVVEFMSGYDLFLLPTRGENFGHVILEALTAGLPVLISDRTRWNDVTAAGAGWALPLDDLGQFTARIDGFGHVGTDERHHMSARAIDFARRYLDDEGARQANLALFAPPKHPAIAVVNYGFPVTTQTFHYRRQKVMLDDGVLQGIYFVRHRNGVMAPNVRALTEVAHHLSPVRVLRSLPFAIAPHVIAPLVKGTITARRGNGEGGRSGFVFQALHGVALGRLLRRSGADVVHASFSEAAGTVAMFAAITAHLPLAMEVHSPAAHGANPDLLACKLARADLIVVISHYTAELVRALLPTAEPQLVHCGLEALPDEADATVDAERRFDVIAVGSLVPKKGHDVLIRASAELQHRLPHRVAIAGDGPLRSELQALIDTTGAPVSLLGEVAPDEIRHLLRGALVSALACVRTASGDEDGVPVALMEAMQLGVPVVSTCVAGVAELLDEGRAGMLVQPGDHVQLADALERALTDADWRQHLASAGSARVAEHFDNAVETRRLIGLIDQLVRGNRDRGAA